MTFDDLAAGDAVFLDANVLVYYFAAHPTFGRACGRLIERIEKQEIVGYVSTTVLSEAAHHLMTFEAAALFGWPGKVVQRLKDDPSKVQQLARFRAAIDQVPRFGVNVLVLPAEMPANAAAISQQAGLLTNDATIIAVMQASGLTKLASSDSDFDCVQGIARYQPT
jgi:predicted nucleic acid-binding protein